MIRVSTSASVRQFGFVVLLQASWLVEDAGAAQSDQVFDQVLGGMAKTVATKAKKSVKMVECILTSTDYLFNTGLKERPRLEARDVGVVEREGEGRTFWTGFWA